MKNWISPIGTKVAILLVGIGLVFAAGCESTKTTSFAPLDLKLEPPPQGGAPSLVVINTSGQTLHHLRFTGDIQNNNTLTYPVDNFAPQLPNRGPMTTYVIRAFDATLESGQTMRFRTQSGQGVEVSIKIPASDILISGTCDEGSFREGWRISTTGEVQRAGGSSK
jgi:hypothetical protein